MEGSDVSDSAIPDVLKHALARSVSKNGDFFLAQSELASLAGRLGDAEVVSLYEFIRDTSMRLEREWRPEFVTAFPLQRGVLPAPLI
jgi:hypothetical protein